MAAPVRSVMVIGYGTMGKGVLTSFAAHGFATRAAVLRRCGIAGCQTHHPRLRVRDHCEFVLLKLSSSDAQSR